MFSRNYFDQNSVFNQLNFMNKIHFRLTFCTFVLNSPQNQSLKNMVFFPMNQLQASVLSWYLFSCPAEYKSPFFIIICLYFSKWNIFRNYANHRVLAPYFSWKAQKMKEEKKRGFMRTLGFLGNEKNVASIKISVTFTIFFHKSDFRQIYRKHLRSQV